MIGPTVTLQYDKFQFTLSENESKHIANKLIQKVFPELDLLIQDSLGVDANYLQSKEKYNVSVGKMHTFRNIDDYSRMSIFIDLFDTVLDVQNKISKELKSDSYLIKPEMVKLYYHNKTLISDENEPLSKLQESYQWFYYQISKPAPSNDLLKINIYYFHK